MRVTVQGRITDKRTSLMHYAAQILAKRSLRITQGSYNAGRVGASAGTHDGGGVLDYSVDGLGATSIQNVTAALRRVGFAAWLRTPADGFAPHIHAVAIGCPDLAPSAGRQVEAYRKGRNGLSNNGPDRQAGLNVQPTTWEAYNAPRTTPWPLTFRRQFGWRAGTRGFTRYLLTARGPHVRRINEAFLGSSSSLWTSRTTAAVREWQGKRADEDRKNGKRPMPITGRVDRRTWERRGL